MLIVVMWACLGLVTLTLMFGQGMSMALRAADQGVAGRQADQAIDGAVRYAETLLANLETPGQLPALDTYAHTDVPVGDARFWFLGAPDSTLPSTEPTFGLADEAARLNLNTATAAMLEALPDITPEFVAAILDWRDEDDDVREGGAESETYLLASPSYPCKNAPFETEEELLLVYQADRDLLYGDDLNRNGALDPDEDNGDGLFDPGLLAYLTVHSHELNQRADGSPRLQLGAPPSEDVTTLFNEAFGEERAGEILGRFTAGGQPPQSLVDVFVRGGMTVEEFDQVGPDLTVSEEPVLEGLVNVNTAGETVLACLPGIDEDAAAKLVAHRLTFTENPASVAWIVEMIGEEAARTAGPFLTARSSQARVDVAAVGRLGRGFRRRLQVVDFSGETPLVVYRQDLSRRGWALGTDLFEIVTDSERAR